jgi:SOS-response transcriptional repressor LexA
MPSKQVGFRLQLNTIEKLNALVAKEGKSQAKVIDTALTAYASGVISDKELINRLDALAADNEALKKGIDELRTLVTQVLKNQQGGERPGRLKETESLPLNLPDSDMFVSEPEPEYGVEYVKTLFVDLLAAGRPIYQSDDRSEYINVPKRFIKTKPEDYYTGRIKGASMTAAGIPDGCLALFRISDTPRDGAIQIVECRGEATVKRMREIPGGGWKICYDDHTGRYIETGPGDEFHIQGDFIAVLPED